MLSNLFPTRAMIAHAARLSLEVEHARAHGIAPSPDALRVLAAAEARYARLSPFEQSLVHRTFSQDREHQSVAASQALNASRAQAFDQQVTNLARQLTPGLAGKPNGVGPELASALRNYSSVEVKTRKLPTGREADARVQRATGLSIKQYEAKLDRALEVRDRAKNGDFDEWRDHVRTHFPGESFAAVDKLVKGWKLESVGLELQRRAQADTPDTVTLKASPEDLRRLDLIEAIAEHEKDNPNSTFQHGHDERLREIVEEGFDRNGNERPGELSLRAHIAAAMIDHGGGFNVNTGGYGEGAEGDIATDEIVALEE